MANDLFGLPGRAVGDGILNYLYDTGNDNLGLDRRNLNFPESHRGRLTWRHMQDLPDGFLLRGELGYLSDRNHLEQYYESEFDTGKDLETLVGLQQSWGNSQWSLLVQPQLYEFENNTEWLPRGDFTFLGEPLLGAGCRGQVTRWPATRSSIKPTRRTSRAICSIPCPTTPT